jgi:DNA-binding response OmpR family regulator
MEHQHPTWARALILEDDLDTLGALGDLLVMNGVSVIQGAQTIGEAEQLLASGFQPSVVVLDLVLGAERGEEFAGRLRADPRYRDVPIIALSGDYLALSRVSTLADRTFLKPADSAELLRAVHEASAWSVQASQEQASGAGAEA